MDFKFVAGVALGMLGGAIIVANSVKARQIVKEGQQTVKDTAEKVMGGTQNKKKK